jgi:hypothetical protein
MMDSPISLLTTTMGPTLHYSKYPWRKQTQFWWSLHSVCSLELPLIKKITFFTTTALNMQCPKGHIITSGGGGGSGLVQTSHLHIKFVEPLSSIFTKDMMVLCAMKYNITNLPILTCLNLSFHHHPSNKHAILSASVHRTRTSFMMGWSFWGTLLAQKWQADLQGSQFQHKSWAANWQPRFQSFSCLMLSES